MGRQLKAEPSSSTTLHLSHLHPLHHIVPGPSGCGEPINKCHCQSRGPRTQLPLVPIQAKIAPQRFSVLERMGPGHREHPHTLPHCHTWPEQRGEVGPGMALVQKWMLNAGAKRVSPSTAQGDSMVPGTQLCHRKGEFSKGVGTHSAVLNSGVEVEPHV